MTANVFKLKGRATVQERRGALALDKSYNFIDKSPLIDELRTEFQKRGISISYAANKSGVTRQTFYRWFDGNCKRPQEPTLRMAGKLVGWNLGWKKR